MVFNDDFLKKAVKITSDIPRLAGVKGAELTQFIRGSPLVTGAAVGTIIGGGLVVAQQIKKRKRKVAPKRKRKVMRARRVSARRPRGRTGFFRKKRHPRKTHKHRVLSGLDRVHRKGKKGISLKAIRASIASPKTPEPLKRGLRKLLRKKSRR